MFNVILMGDKIIGAESSVFDQRKCMMRLESASTGTPDEAPAANAAQVQFGRIVTLLR